MKTVSAFDPGDLPFMEPTAKIGLLATISPEGLPHLTLITSMQGKTPTELVWGQFTAGQSKKHVTENPKTGFLIMTMDRKLWRGKADYRTSAKEGDDYVMYNQKPMFRYNSYFGIHTVHYMDLLETGGRESLPLHTVAPASILTAVASAYSAQTDNPALSTFGRSLINRVGALKFAAYVGDEGYPVIVPLLQCLAPTRGKLLFSPIAYRDELEVIPVGRDMAVFALTLAMEDVLVRGKFNGFSRRRGVRVGEIEIEWVYNSMPPKMEQIYPPVPLEPIRDFR